MRAAVLTVSDGVVAGTREDTSGDLLAELLAGDGYEVYAPRGFDDIAGLIARPNPGPNFSAASYAVKAARWKALWPELTVIAAE